MTPSTFRPLTAQHGIIELTSLSDGVVRVRAGRRRKLPAYQSLAVTLPTENTAEAAPSTLAAVELLEAKITLGTRGDQIVARGQLAPQAHVYGLGEKTGWLDKRGRRYTMRTSDLRERAVDEG